MVPDPYKALGLAHSATAHEIKRAYREKARQFHPDRTLRQDQATQQAAAAKFAACAAAYALLSDAKRKAEYDHIYKYGGYDDIEEEPIRSRGGFSSQQASSRKRKCSSSSEEMGIGYTCYDPLAFLWTQGQIHSRRTVAGIHVPSRINNAANLRFAYSSGQIRTSPSGTRECSTQTIQFAHGKKYTVKETVTYHPDGRKEVVIEGDDSVERRYSTYNVTTQQQELPWYLSAWQEIKDKLSMCHNPCAVVTQ